MRAGRLRHRIALQSATEARDSHGQPVKTWTTQALIWAGVEPLRGKEMETAHQVAAEATVRIVMRYRSDITADWRIVFDSHTYEIVAPPLNPDMRNIELHLMCREVN